jgi:excisionase family DNA binding protein
MRMAPVRCGFPLRRRAVAEQRFLTLADVGEVLNISSSQTYALVRSGELPAIQIGGRGQWRVEAQVLEEFIARAYEKSASAARDAPPDRKKMSRQ